MTKKMAVDLASNNWIFSIDADEVVSDGLKNKIIEILKSPPADAFSIRRESFYLGKKIRHCGWNNDYPLRLFNRQKGNFNEKIIHESVEVSGSKIRLQAHLDHYTYPTIKSHLQKLNHYSHLGATSLLNKGKKGSLSLAFFRGFAKFLKMYFLQFGFLDKKRGLILSINSAFGVFLKYLKLWEMTKK